MVLVLCWMKVDKFYSCCAENRTGQVTGHNSSTVHCFKIRSARYVSSASPNGMKVRRTQKRLYSTRYSSIEFLTCICRTMICIVQKNIKFKKNCSPFFSLSSRLRRARSQSQNARKRSQILVTNINWHCKLVLRLVIALNF